MGAGWEASGSGADPSTDLEPAWLTRFPASTAASYRHDIHLFRLWMGDRSPLAATRADVQKWIRHLTHSGLQPSTIRRKASALSSFFAYAVEEEAIAANPAAHTYRPPGDTGQRLGLSDGEARKLIGAARAHSPKALALVAVMILSGLRVSEACGLDIDDIGSDAGRPIIRVTRKGGKTARIPIPISTLGQQLLTEAIGKRTTGPIFVGTRGGRLRRQDAGRLIASLGESAGLPRTYPHLLRHTAATTAIRSGADVRRVQQMLGHASHETTAKYLHAIEAIDKSPVDLVTAALMGEADSPPSGTPKGEPHA